MLTNPSSLTSINEHIQRKSMKSSSISRLNKERSIRKFLPGQLNDKHQESSKKMFNDNQISLQISKEMKQIEDLLFQVRPQLEQISRKNNERSIMEILFDLQDKIKRKNYLLTQINIENKELKSDSRKGVRYSESSHDFQFNPQKQQQTFKLAQQLKNQKESLVRVKNVHLQKKQNLQQIKIQVTKLESQYIEKCKKTKEKPMTYEMFKCLNEEKKKELIIEVKHEERRKSKRQTLQEMLRSNSFNTSLNKNKAEKNLKDIVNHKKIAQQALKTAKKKYNQEISEFYAKLEFLREEDLALVQTLRQKQFEFQTLENKFNEFRRHLIGNASSSQTLKLQNTHRFKGDSQFFGQMLKTRKHIKFLSPQHI